MKKFVDWYAIKSDIDVRRFLGLLALFFCSSVLAIVAFNLSVRHPYLEYAGYILGLIEVLSVLLIIRLSLRFLYRELFGGKLR